MKSGFDDRADDRVAHRILCPVQALQYGGERPLQVPQQRKGGHQLHEASGFGIAVYEHPQWLRHHGHHSGCRCSDDERRRKDCLSLQYTALSLFTAAASDMAGTRETERA